MSEQSREIVIILGTEKAKMTLLEMEAPKTCDAVWNLLPIESHALHAKFAGDEFFFMIPKILEPENEKADVSAGDVGYYPGRQTMCIFYGKIKPFGPVSVFAKITGNLPGVRRFGEKLKARIPDSVEVKVERS